MVKYSEPAYYRQLKRTLPLPIRHYFRGSNVEVTEAERWESFEREPERTVIIGDVGKVGDTNLEGIERQVLISDAKPKTIALIQRAFPKRSFGVTH